MGKVSFHFFTTLFNGFLVFITLVNLLGWSGGAINFTGSLELHDWSTSYFGFQSLRSCVDFFNKFTTGVEALSIANLPTYLKAVANTLTFGIPSLISTFAGDLTFNITTALSIIANLLFQPIILICEVFMILGIAFNLVLGGIMTIVYALSGAFNVDFVDVVPKPYESTATAVLLSNPLLALGV